MSFRRKIKKTNEQTHSLNTLLIPSTWGAKRRVRGLGSPLSSVRLKGSGNEPKKRVKNAMDMERRRKL